MNNTLSTSIIAGAVLVGGVGGALINETISPELVEGETKVIVDTENLKDLDSTEVQIEQTSTAKDTVTIEELKAQKEAVLKYAQNYVNTCNNNISSLEAQITKFDELISKVETEVKKYVPEN